MDSQEIVNKLTSDACLSLFSDYSLPLQPVEAGDELDVDLLYCAVIGFSSEQMRGTLLLATTSEPLGRTTPVEGASLREWIAELCNQLLGRIKRLLIERGVVLALSTPIVLRGDRLRPLPNRALHPLLYACEGGSVCVWMDAELKPDLDLTQIQREEEAVAEGEALLF